VVQKASAESEESQRRQRPLVVFQFQPIRGDLLNQELIVRQIVIERADDPVAISVGERVSPLFLENVSLRIRIASYIEPVSSLALAIMRRRKQSIDQLLKRVGGTIVDEIFDLFC